MKREGDTKQKLIKVAAKLIWEQSYGSVGVDDICKKAGVTKGSFYFAFPSKADLTVAAMEDQWQVKQPKMDAIFSAQNPPLTQLEQYCAFIVDDQRCKCLEYGKVCGCPACSLGSELSTQEEKIRVKTEEIIHRIIRYLTGAVLGLQTEGLISRQEDAKSLARQIYDYAIGLMLQAKIENKLETLDRLKPGVFRILGIQTVPVATIPKAA